MMNAFLCVAGSCCEICTQSPPSLVWCELGVSTGKDFEGGILGRNHNEAIILSSLAVFLEVV